MKTLRKAVVVLLALVMALTMFACVKQEPIDNSKQQTELVGEISGLCVKLYYGTNKDEPFKTIDSAVVKDMELKTITVKVNKDVDGQTVIEDRVFKGIALTDVYTKLGLTVADVTSIEFFSGTYHKGFKGEDYTANNYYLVFSEKDGDTFVPLGEDGPVKNIFAKASDNTLTSTKAWVKNLDKIVLNYKNEVTLKNANGEKTFFADNIGLTETEISVDTVKAGVTTTNVFKAIALSEILTKNSFTAGSFNQIKLTARDGFSKEFSATALTNMYIAIAVKNSDNTFSYYDDFSNPYVRFVNSSETASGNWIKELRTIEFKTVE